MRVGFLIDRWEPARGGAERALAGLAASLERAGHEVAVCAERSSAGAPGRFVPVRVPFGAWTRGGRERARARALAAAAERAGCDATVGLRHLERVDLYWPHAGAHRRGLEARAEARGRRLSRVQGRHAVFLELERVLLSGGARRVACVSELVRAELAELYPESMPRLELVPNGVDLERFHPRARESTGAALRARLGIDPGAPLLAFAARDPWLKGLPALLAALAGLQQRPWTLVAAGSRHPRRWRARVTSAGLGRGRVLVREHVSGAELFAAADLLVHPTWRDPAPLVVLEALASGTPVVTTRRAGNAGCIGPGAGSVLDDPGDVAALQAALAGWLERLADPEACAAARSAARAAVLHRGLAPSLERLHALLAELAGQSERRSGEGSSGPGAAARW